MRVLKEYGEYFLENQGLQLIENINLRLCIKLKLS